MNTCDICDHYKEDNSGALRVFPPLFHSYGGLDSCSGLIVTVKCFEDNAILKSELEKEGRGRVMVVDGGNSMRRALTGGNLATIATKNGWAGIVVNGCIRDVEELSALSICIMALGVNPLPPVKKNSGMTGEPLNLFGFWIQPGEFIVADRNGIAVVPQALGRRGQNQTA